MGTCTKLGLQSLKFSRLRTPLSELMDTDGTVTSSQEHMMRITEDFYAALFAKDQTDHSEYLKLTKMAEPFLKSCSTQESSNLIRPVSRGELIRALKDAPKGKAAGPDQIIVDIYKALNRCC
ncbi:hypothetical protein DSO57_1009975 [Entomophthora muscae]|uniref:Uncharacterized protein n=1 Tax=Entomophthora muscae TaxID=34485 RepID=A0ACC2UT95_9FUNG|nr:hypothetical protein DSO57_1009975 [Entomophthora muscae]